MALNHFADLTFEEFSKTRLGLVGAKEHRSNTANTATPFRYADVTGIPSSKDWREEGVVTPVKNQGSCGSCWAFSTTGAIEGINALKTGELVSLSEQQLVSCDTSKDMGCGGGLMDFAFDYVAKNGGIDTEEDYQYWSFDLPCQHRKAEDRTVVTIDGHEDVPVNDGDALKKAVAHQPVSVAICASGGLQFYKSGVITEDACCTDLNHGVLAVGYVDTDAVVANDDNDEQAHWIIKNSWGSGWGDEGFFKLAMKSEAPEGVCGVHKSASYPFKDSDTNPEVPSMCGYFGWTECPVQSTCVCQWSFFELFCFTWGCQAE
jgi:cathepsin L